MAPDLSSLGRALDRSPYGLILLGTHAGPEVRQALWEQLAGCETLYWVGPLAEKPVVRGPARCWLLEGPLEGRADGVRAVLRRDPHAVHAIGPCDRPLFELLVHGALSGLVTVAELDAHDVDGLLAEARALLPQAELTEAALLGALDATGAQRLLRARR